MSKKPEAKSFAAFAAANPARQQCWLCRLDPDLRALVRQARLEQGGSYNRISLWLRADHDMKISEAAVRAHFANGHEQ